MPHVTLENRIYVMMMHVDGIFIVITIKYDL